MYIFSAACDYLSVSAFMFVSVLELVLNETGLQGQTSIGP